MRTWAALLIGAVVYAAGTVWAAAHLPLDGVPLHLDAAGVADRFGSRSAALTLLISLGAGVSALGAILIGLAHRGPLRLMNIPHREYWLAAERRPRLRAMLGLDLARVIGATLAFLTLVPIWLVLGAAGPIPAVLIWAPIAIYALGLVSWTVWLTRSRYRPPA